MNKVEIHAQLCQQMHELYERKNADYGDSFSQLRKRYPNFVCMRLFDKLNRLDTIIQPGYELQVSDEKIEDTLMDIANYAIMELTERRASVDGTDQSSSKVHNVSGHKHITDLLYELSDKYKLVRDIGCEGIDCREGCPAYVNSTHRCIFTMMADLARGEKV